MASASNISKRFRQKQPKVFKFCFCIEQAPYLSDNHEWWFQPILTSTFFQFTMAGSCTWVLCSHWTANCLVSTPKTKWLAYCNWWFSVGISLVLFFFSLLLLSFGPWRSELVICAVAIIEMNRHNDIKRKRSRNKPFHVFSVCVWYCFLSLVLY